ncbi:MAG TPA: DHA2 family efflux MFS transporter permease subunit, partial [Mycobacteriales bacterium]
MTGSTKRDGPPAALPRGGGLPREWWPVVAVVIAGATMSFLDSTIVNVALRSLSVDLAAPLDRIQWVVTAYLLSLAAVIPVTGWAARRFGARRVYLFAVVVFTVASVACGLSRTAGELITFRAVQGLGGGMIMPVGQMILARRAGPQNMARVMSAVGVPIVLAPVFGPTIGGLLLQYVGWQSIFFVNLPIGVVAVLLAVRLLPRDRAEPTAALDATGLGMVVAGMVAITYGLADVGRSGRLDSPRVLVTLAAGLVLLAAFVLRALRIERPLLDVRLYRNAMFGAASLAMFCLGVAMYGAMILMPLYYQTVRHQDAVATGLLLAPGGLGAAIANWLTGRLTERIGSGPTALLGGVISIVATVPFVTIGADSSYVLLTLGMIVRGVGIGLSIVPAMTAAYRVIDRSRINDATPQLSIVQRLGGSIGTAILAIVLQNQLGHSGG